MIDMSREVSESLGPARSGRLQKKSGNGSIRRRTLNRLSGTPLIYHPAIKVGLMPIFQTYNNNVLKWFINNGLGGWWSLRRRINASNFDKIRGATWDFSLRFLPSLSSISDHIFYLFMYVQFYLKNLLEIFPKHLVINDKKTE